MKQKKTCANKRPQKSDAVFASWSTHSFGRTICWFKSVSSSLLQKRARSSEFCENLEEKYNADDKDVH